MNNETKSIHDLDLEDDFEESKQWTEQIIPEENKLIENEPINYNDEDLLTIFLKEKGIKNLSEVKIENDNGEIETKDFYSLTKEEQLSILNDTPIIEDDYDLEEDEIDLLNELRTNNLTTKEYIDYIKQSAIEEYLANQEEEYEVNSLTDDELYYLDIKNKFPNFSDEELLEVLEHEKQNETLFNKKIENLRDFYIEREKEYNQDKIYQTNIQKEQDDILFKTEILNSAQNIKNIGEFELEQSDREEVSNFLLEKDVTGVKYFDKALKEPESLFKMAWFLLKGDDAFNDLSNYYKDRITEYSKINYEKGFNDAKNGKQIPTSRVVRQETRSTVPKPSKRELSINDLD